jgi:alpha 1,2-mannosyltransferase
MLDSDNTALSDPTPLLDSEPFLKHGSIFWPDFWTNQWMQPALYR